TNLPRLQKVIRYYDDFSDEHYSIRDGDEDDEWDLIFDGQEFALEFRFFEPAIRPVVKHWCAFMLCDGLAPATVYIRFESLRRISPARLQELLRTKPQQIRSFWRILLAENPDPKRLDSVKSLMYFLCRFAICGWKPDFRVLLSQLPLPKVDKYAAVRTGDVFLSIQEEAALVRYIDELTRILCERPAEISNDQ